MTDAFLIEAHRQTAGVAVRDRRGFRFFAAAEPFFALDKRLFPHLRAVRRAVEALAGKHGAGRAARPAPR